MNDCKDIPGRITLWLDGELQNDEISQLESHMDRCASCRECLASEKRFLETVRSAKPLHLASHELGSKVETILAAHQPLPDSRAGLRQQVRRWWRQLAAIQQSLPPLRLQYLAVLVLIVVAGVGIGFWRSDNQDPKGIASGPSSFALMAADTHRRYLQRQLPLEIVSQVPDQISAWFAGKVPFGVKLPDYQEQSGQLKLYKLEGARLVGYQDDYAAYVVYEMYQRPIGLVVTSDSVAQPAGGEEIVARGLTFHFDSIYGYKVITWSDRGLTYALVSDLEERGQKSCVVCHQGAEDKDLLELDRAVSQLRLY
jgi:anti-sigma factor RsiW